MHKQNDSGLSSLYLPTFHIGLDNISKIGGFILLKYILDKEYDFDVRQTCLFAPFPITQVNQLKSSCHMYFMVLFSYLDIKQIRTDEAVIVRLTSIKLQSRNDWVSLRGKISLEVYK